MEVWAIWRLWGVCAQVLLSETATLQLLHDDVTIKISLNGFVWVSAEEAAQRKASDLYLNETLVSSLWQGAKKMTFQLEVWSKTEDVVQTLLQVRRLGGRSRRITRSCCICLTTFSMVLSCLNLVTSAAPQGFLSGKAWRSDCDGESIISTYRRKRWKPWMIDLFHIILHHIITHDQTYIFFLYF